jgi:hypothetical protein
MATPTTLPSTFTAGQVLTAAQMNNLRGAFRVLQVVSTTKTDTFTTSSTTLVDVTGLSASITPSATTSKVLVIVHMTTALDGAATNGVYATLLRGATPISVGDASGSRAQVTTDQGVTSFSNGINNLAFIYLDSPATTSATTYKLQVRSETAAALYVNRSRNDANNSGVGRGTSSITVMEISA